MVNIPAKQVCFRRYCLKKKSLYCLNEKVYGRCTQHNRCRLITIARTEVKTESIAELC